MIRGADGTGTQAVNGAQTLSFTSAPDTTPPLLRAAVPADNAVNVALGENIALTFTEAVTAGAGSFTLTNGSDDVRTIAATDTGQVAISGAVVTINPSVDLRPGSAYSVQVSANALADSAGNAFAGIQDTTTLNFVTFGVAPTPVPSLLITEVNSNATGGDFFEIYNYGTTAVNLLGWKWDDDSANVADAGSASFPAVSIAAGQRLVVVAAADTSAFLSAWGLAGTNVPVVAMGGPGLGKGDAIVLFDAVGKVAASFSYGTSPVTASDGTIVRPANAAPGVTPVYAEHAGFVFGGSATSSAVWDGASTSAPAYRAAVAGVAGGFAQPASAGSVGSPGL